MHNLAVNQNQSHIYRAQIAHFNATFLPTFDYVSVGTIKLLHDNADFYASLHGLQIFKINLSWQFVARYNQVDFFFCGSDLCSVSF